MSTGSYFIVLALDLIWLGALLGAMLMEPSR